MIILDHRVGSGELLHPLRRRGLPVSIEKFADTDVQFVSRSGVSVGVEVKKLGDILQCIVDKRFARNQLPKLSKFDQRWFVAVGQWRPGTGKSSGLLMVPKPRGVGRWRPWPHSYKKWKWTAVAHWLMTLEMEGRVRVARVRDQDELLAWIHALYSWWMTNKPHTSHLPTVQKGGFEEAGVFVVPPSEFFCQIMQYRGVGPKRAGKIERRFRSMKKLTNATPEMIAVALGSKPADLKLGREIWAKIRTAGL